MVLPPDPANDSGLPNLGAPNLRTITDNLARVRARIAAAAAHAGRREQDVTLVAVSKTHPAAMVQAALQAGQHIFGENRVQEAAAKFPALRAAWPDLRLHLIGALQTNKANQAAALADRIESLDRPRLAEALARAPAHPGLLPDLLIEVNVADEPQKAGVTRAGTDAFVTACRARFGARLVGLMCVPPVGADPAPHFAWLADRAARHGLAVLSMGMSADFDIAIAHGATHVRVGTAIFGHRETTGR
jgi:PLP dependent protein